MNRGPIRDKLNKLSSNQTLMAALKGLCMIAMVTVIAVVSVKLLMGDTLSDYAEKNPEIAYAPSKESIPEDTAQLIDELNEAQKAKEEAQTLKEPAGEQPDSDTADVQSAGDTAPDARTGTELSPEASADDDIASKEQTPDDINTDAQIPEYGVSPMIHFYDPVHTAPGRVSVGDGFYYEELSEDVISYITGVSFPDSGDTVIGYDDLRYVGILYNDFSGSVQAGELICNKAVANDLAEIFRELYTAGYQFDSVVLVDNYGGDDTASMAADNTSCFNYRVVDGSESLSKHAYGRAIDINPYYNPYVVFGAGEGGGDYISPPGSEIYADRSRSFAYKIDEDDLCYRLFTEHGFVWGGNWNSCKDYQHFQKTQ